LCRCDVQRRCACGKHSGDRESHSGLGRKPFAFPSESLFTFNPESLFAFNPESFSRSPRNPHYHAATAEEAKQRLREFEQEWDEKYLLAPVRNDRKKAPEK
jgi:hypothetical protein